MTCTSSFRILVTAARIRRSAWRRRLADLRFEAGENLLFLAMVGLLILGVAGIVCFAYLNGVQVQRQAQEREAARAARRAREVQCLADNVYFEARGEPLAGQYAVAEVTLNRMQAPNFPRTICAVVHETRWDPRRRRFVADFSWTELDETAPQNGAAWKQALAVATAELDDLREPVVPGALYYHSTRIHPGWSRTRKVVATIGNHIFYQ